ncbi:MAG: hypothetical protein U1E30_12765 [Rhodoblastus sp.]
MTDEAKREATAAKTEPKEAPALTEWRGGPRCEPLNLMARGPAKAIRRGTPWTWPAPEPPKVA